MPDAMARTTEIVKHTTGPSGRTAWRDQRMTQGTTTRHKIDPARDQDSNGNNFCARCGQIVSMVRAKYGREPRHSGHMANVYEIDGAYRRMPERF